LSNIVTKFYCNQLNIDNKYRRVFDNKNTFSPLPVFTKEGSIGLPFVRQSVRQSVCPLNIWITILLQCHAVTLPFKVANQMLRVHIVHIATYSRTKFHAPRFLSYQRIQIFSGKTNGRTDGRTDERLTYSPLLCEHR